ncbi:dual specificity protein phosphatase [Spiroplasma endosymbiont of Panorpa germanica]|uniref:dual specificity protein phosphatase family protein n=1 Tax=Spiroplasma endosymbiont of Panorpa germanica TaxID=3066314 RepID=UPI0030D15FD4
MKKITDNLYLGDRHSAPVESDIIISCAQEMYQDIIKDDKNYSNQGAGKHYFNFEDYPDVKGLDPHLVFLAVNLIENNVSDKQIYVHCIWGINRSASIVFIYLVRNNLLPQSDFKTAQKAFQKIYPPFSPNPGWQIFLINNFPFDKLC